MAFDIAALPPHAFSAKAYARLCCEEVKAAAFGANLTAVCFATPSEVVAASASGVLALFDIDGCLEPASGAKAARSHASFTDAPINNICSLGGAARPLIACAHDSGVRVYDLDDLRSCQGGALASRSYMPTPQRQLRRGGLEPRAEVNAVARLPAADGGAAGSTGLLSAHGDGRCALWDLERSEPVRLFEAHSGSAYAVVGTGATGLVATGGADGFVCLWDPRAEGCVHRLEVAIPAEDGGADQRLGWVSALHADDAGNWLSCVGGRTTGVHRGGICSVHLASRSVIATRACPAVIHAVAATGDALLTVGEERSVRRWSPTDLRPLPRIASTCATIVSIAVRDAPDAGADSEQVPLAVLAGRGAGLDVVTLDSNTVAATVPLPLSAALA